MITEKRVRKKLPLSFCQKITFDAIDKCWLWRGVLNNGYGKVSIKTAAGKYSTTGAHRYMWSMLFGKPPKELYVCHDCPEKDNPQCVNPNHLWLGTHKENMADRRKKYKPPYGKRTVHKSIKIKKPLGTQVKNFLIMDASSTPSQFGGKFNAFVNHLIIADLKNRNLL